MRQSLVVGAKPRFSANTLFPRVRLGVGRWRIETENRKGTRLALLVFTTTSDHTGDFETKSQYDINDELVVNGLAEVAVIILEPDGEDYINVVAVRDD